MIYFIFYFTLFFFAFSHMMNSRSHSALFDGRKIIFHKDKVFLLASIFLLLIICLRDTTIGTDTPEYMLFFTNINGGMYGTVQEPNESIEPGFVYLGKILQTIFLKTKEPFLYIMSTGLLTTIPFLYLVNKYSANKALSLLIAFTAVRGSFLFLYMAAIRQFLGIALIMIALVVLIEKPKRYLYKYVLLSAVAICFHYSMLIPAVIFYIFTKINFTKKIYYGILLSSSVLSLVLVNISKSIILPILLYFADNTENMKYLYYMSDDSYSSLIGISSIIMNLSIPSIFVYLTDEKNINNIFLKCYVFAPCIFLMFGSFEQISRLVAVFWIVGASGVIPKSNKENTFYFIVVFLILLFSIWRIYYGISVRDMIFEDTVPYKFIFE